MVAIYVAAFLVGIAILVFGLVAGNLDHSFGDHDTVDGENPIWIPFLSPRFWIYGLGSFGLAGILCTLASVPNTLVLAIVTGALTGLVVSTATRYLLRRAETTSDYRLESLLGHTGSVTVPIRPESRGKVRLNRQDEVLEIFAKASSPTAEIMPGSPVIVVGVEGDTLEVISQDEVLS
ncbi:MAG: NfeD family protein [Armatimonadetes bacterium]|nr:hypothetical protein [Armatimonadota bacterium]MBS1703286.1 NfeD family protein [Armatimonadota bacterium]MBS1727313.1 NfeD family protein [Armatimonadota bacterium]